MVLTFKEHDTHNAIKSTLIKKGKPMDLTQCKVYITISDVVFEDECHIVSAADGVVAYPIGKISHQSGFLNYEYVLKYEDGTKEIVPNNGYEKLRIYRRIKE